MRRLLPLGVLLALAGCEQPAPPAAPARYMVGQPYEMGGMWSYPKEAFSGSETGVATVLAASSPPRRTANGELFDPGNLVAAHRTLQLPAIVTVLNLENGREIQVRVNDRGPANPARVIGLSQRAGTLLGIPQGGSAQVRLTIETAPSQALAGQMPSPERVELPVATAPRGQVERESLAPLAGTREATRVREAPQRGPAVTTVGEARPDLPPDPLPEQLLQRAAQPGRLVLEAGSFFRRDLAQRQAARVAGLRARVEQQGSGRSAMYRVVAGPYYDLREADAAFGGALAQGLPEARLRVE